MLTLMLEHHSSSSQMVYGHFKIDMHFKNQTVDTTIFYLLVTIIMLDQNQSLEALFRAYLGHLHRI